jgi:hypothetical protein
MVNTLPKKECNSNAKVVEPGYPISNPQLDMSAHIFLNLFQNLSGAIISMVDDMPHVVSSILRIYWFSLS